MPDRIRIICHSAVPQCGSFEVRFPDGRPSRVFYWDDIPGRKLRPGTFTSEKALQEAKTLARIERDKLQQEATRPEKSGGPPLQRGVHPPSVTAFSPSLSDNTVAAQSEVSFA